MEFELEQTFIPIVHRVIDEGMVTKSLSWLKKYWWMIGAAIVVIVVGIVVGRWLFIKKPEQPTQETQPVVEKPTQPVVLNLFQKPVPPTAT